MHYEVNLDVSLSGHVLATWYMNHHIIQLEMLSVVLSLKIYANIWANKRMKIYYENLALVEILNSGKTRDPFLATCARNVGLITAIFNIDIIIIHIPGFRIRLLICFLDRLLLIIHNTNL